MLMPFLMANTFFTGLLVSFTGGLVYAINAYSKERRNLPPTFDAIDFVLLTATSTFAGFIGFMLASSQLESKQIVLAITGLAAIGGYSMLVSIKDMCLDTLRLRLESRPATLQRIVVDTQSYKERDAVVQDMSQQVDPAQPPHWGQRRTDGPTQ